DADGFLSVIGRLRDTIICGGFNIYPAQLEAALNSVVAVCDRQQSAFPTIDWGRCRWPWQC
ncbi:MAG: hypothetical protein ACXWD8_19585, partial [Mycobacterium sp.]